jgi:ABC-type branched-subunit amino acid transport system ATPase component
MRAQAFAIVGMYIFLMGGLLGGLLGGAFSDSWGQRTALTIIVPPAAVLGGLLIVHGGRHTKSDISLGVIELLEEQQERQRMAYDPAGTAVVHVHNLDVSYGGLQVLFEVDVEVHRGETLALLGTNGAGKSTLLRAISGMVAPDRGVIRLNGRTITLVAPELRASMGIVQIPGDDAVFGSMTVQENLDIWSRPITDPDQRRAVFVRVRRVFTVLDERRAETARALSGGQQQLLALSRALLYRPEILLIDEPSRGLAPAVVQDVLGVLRRLKADGVTMIIVEQSIDAALAVADRAVYLERGRVSFDGPAHALLERDDLLRPVFG